MQRRKFLASVTAVAASVSGCVGDGTDTGQDDPGDNDSAQREQAQTATNDSEHSDDGGEPVEPDTNDTDATDDANTTEDATENRAEDQNGTNTTDDDPPDAEGEPERADPGSEEVATEEDFEIIGHDITRDSYGDALVVGELEYTGDVVAYYVEVVATFFDEAGNELPGRKGVGNHYNHASDVPPDTTLSFEIVTWIDYDDVAEYELDIWVG